MKEDSTGRSDGRPGRLDVRALWHRAARLGLQAARRLEPPAAPAPPDPDLGQWEPDLCIQMLRIPAAQNYVAINKLLKQASKQWMLEFLECDGLGVLLESLERLGARGFCSVADTFSQLQCVSCLRAVMNSQVGLEYIVQHREYTRQLVNILMSRNNSVKLQVFELLCALCIYSSQGHSLALDSLSYFKQMSHGRRYRFDLVIHELQTADTAAYQTTLLTFLNCVILGARDLPQRNRIRTELFGLGLEKVLTTLRYTDDDSLQIQLKVFDDNQAKDEEVEEPLSITHLFDVLYKKVVNTPQALALQSVLLGLSEVDPADPDSDYLWDALQEVISDIQYKRKPTRRNLSVRTREFGTQTTGNRWVSTKRRASYSTIGVQVDAVKITPALSLPMINDTSVDNSDLTRSPESRLEATSDLSLTPNSSVEICKNCLRKFVREGPLRQNTTKSTLTSTGDSSNQNIPNSESSSPFHQNSRLSFTKIKKSLPPQTLTNQRSNSITVDEPLIKSITPTQVSPNSRSPLISRTMSDEQVLTVPIPPPLPNSGVNSPEPTVSSTKVQNQFIPPPPPPLPPTCRNASSLSPPPPPPLPLLTSSFVPPPPPLPQSESFTVPPPPPLPSLPSCFVPPPPPLPQSVPLNLPPCPPPPPPPPPSSCPPPPPPPQMLFVNSIPFPPQSNSLDAGAPPPPPPMFLANPIPNGHQTLANEPLIVSERAVESMFAAAPFKTTSNYHTLPSRKPQLMDFDLGFHKFNTLPKPSKKMKTLNWIKVPNQVISKSVWASANLPPVPIDYSQIEELFCQKPRAKLPGPQSSTESQAPLTTLLDSKRSLAVNIFLKQFKSGASGVLEALRSCESDALSTERLKGFLRILPDENEVALIKSHAGDVSTLDTAERFYAELLQVPDYTLRAQAMLQKEECPVAVTELVPQLESVIHMCDSLIHNSNLAEFLALLLQLGNYLNAGSYAGNAAGFKLNTLPKLVDTRANKPRITFLHFAVNVAQTHRSDLLSFTDEMASLRAMARNPLSAVAEEVKSLAAAVRKLDKQIKSARSKDILPKFKESQCAAMEGVVRLEQLLEEARAAEKKLAQHFCEDPNKFQLEECFTLLADFFSKVKQATMDNEQMKKQEERAARMEAEKSSFVKTQSLRKKHSKQKILQQEDESDLIDILIKEMKSGNFKRRVPAVNRTKSLSHSQD